MRSDSLNCMVTCREAVECKDTLGSTVSANCNETFEKIRNGEMLQKGSVIMICNICGRSDSECHIRKIKNMYLCPRHTTQYYRNGSFNDNTIYQPNEYIIYDDYAEIILKNKDCKEVGRAIIDIDDVDKCKEYKWHIRKSNNAQYVIASIKGSQNKKIHLHRLIMNYDGKLDIDHINMNGLDNRKKNLRIVTHSENKANNKFIGVKLVPSGRWQASICRNYKTIYIGTFDSKEDAIKAREEFIKSLQLVS